MTKDKTSVDNYIKLTMLLICSFAVASFTEKSFFISHSPKLNTNFAKDFSVNSQLLLSNIINFNNGVAHLRKDKGRPITSGVRAEKESNVSFIEYKLDQVEWVNVTYTDQSGKTVIIKIPKGMEKLYK